MEKAAMVGEITRQLKAAGLTVVLPSGVSKGWAELVVSGNVEKNVQAARGWGLIGYFKDQWYFQSWVSIPGPDSETVEYYTPNREEIIAVTFRFFNGKAEKVGGWFVPLHRHPEWNRARLQQTMQQALTLSPGEWDDVAQRFSEHYLQLAHEFGRVVRIDQRDSWSWARWFACLVVFLEHEDPSAPVLWVRRDLKEAFLVKERCPSCQCATLTRTSMPVQTDPLHIRCPTYVCNTCTKTSWRSLKRLLAGKP